MKKKTKRKSKDTKTLLKSSIEQGDDCKILDHSIRVLNPGESTAVYYRCSKEEAIMMLNNLNIDCQQSDAVISESISTGLLVIISYPRTKRSYHRRAQSSKKVHH